MTDLLLDDGVIGAPAGKPKTHAQQVDYLYDRQHALEAEALADPARGEDWLEGRNGKPAGWIKICDDVVCETDTNDISDAAVAEYYRCNGLKR